MDDFNREDVRRDQLVHTLPEAVLGAPYLVGIGLGEKPLEADARIEDASFEIAVAQGEEPVLEEP
jgi:hypothetical protein